jgi:hypothetical protein
MTSAANTAATPKRHFLSLDGWAVFLAFLAALLVRAGVVKHIPW